MTDYSQDALTVLIGTLTKSIESTAGLAVKVDNLKDAQTRQEGKLDGVLVGLAELKTQTSTIHQAVESTRKDVADHEIRLRDFERLVPDVTANKEGLYRVDRQLAEFKEKQEIHNQSQAVAITDLEKSLIRYGAIAMCLLFALQAALSLFVAPWIQQTFFGQ